MDFGIGGWVVSFAGIRKWLRIVTSDLTFLTAVLTFRLFGLEGYIRTVCESPFMEDAQINTRFSVCCPVFYQTVSFLSQIVVPSTPSRLSSFYKSYLEGPLRDPHNPRTPPLNSLLL